MGFFMIVLLQKGWNIIHQVCCNGDLAILKWLLEKEPELNTKLSQQSTVIARAIFVKQL